MALRLVGATRCWPVLLVRRAQLGSRRGLGPKRHPQFTTAIDGGTGAGAFEDLYQCFIQTDAGASTASTECRFATLTRSRPVHLALVYDRGVLRTFHNGVVSQRPASPLNWSGPAVFNLSFTGQPMITFDLVALYSTALTTEEIARNYAAGPSSD